jgi:NADH:ubiquinone oxidoreductase subunit K
MNIWDGCQSPQLQITGVQAIQTIQSYGVVERHDDVTIVCSIEFLWKSATICYIVTSHHVCC